MSITIVEKSQPTRKKNPTLALVLSGGAISGGAFKVGGLIALDVLFSNFSMLDFHIYLGISAGSFLAAPLAGGIPPQESLKALTGRSKMLTAFSFMDFYWPNLGEITDKGGEFAHEALALYPKMAWSLARLAAKSGAAAFTSMRGSKRNRSSRHKDIFEPSLRELALLYDQLPSPANFVPSGVFDNKRIEHYVRSNFQRARIPNNFLLLETERKKRLYIHAVDLDTAGDVFFGPDERSDVTISEATQASTALPGFYRPARINGRYYIDGSAKKTAPIELAGQKGADLILCYNPFRPFFQAPTKSLSARYSSLGEMGFTKVIDQSIRTLLHSRLSLAIRHLGNDPSFKGDVVVMEPAETDRDFFDINPLAFWKRAVAAKYGFLTVTRDVERNFPRLKEILGRYSLELDLGRLAAVADKVADANNDEEIVNALGSLPLPKSWSSTGNRSGLPGSNGG